MQPEESMLGENQAEEASEEMNFPWARK